MSCPVCSVLSLSLPSASQGGPAGGDIGSIPIKPAEAVQIPGGFGVIPGAACCSVRLSAGARPCRYRDTVHRRQYCDTRPVPLSILTDTAELSCYADTDSPVSRVRRQVTRWRRSSGGTAAALPPGWAAASPWPCCWRCSCRRSGETGAVAGPVAAAPPPPPPPPPRPPPSSPGGWERMATAGHRRACERAGGGYGRARSVPRGAAARSAGLVV